VVAAKVALVKAAVSRKSHSQPSGLFSAAVTTAITTETIITTTITMTAGVAIPAAVAAPGAVLIPAVPAPTLAAPVTVVGVTPGNHCTKRLEKFAGYLESI